MNHIHVEISLPNTPEMLKKVGEVFPECVPQIKGMGAVEHICLTVNLESTGLDSDNDARLAFMAEISRGKHLRATIV